MLKKSVYTTGAKTMQNIDYLDTILENEPRIPLDVRRHLQSSNPWQRSDGAEYISYLPWDIAGPVLKAMAENDPHWDVCMSVVNALQHYAPELSNPVLAKIARTNQDMGVRERANEILSMTGMTERPNVNGRDGVAKLPAKFILEPNPVKQRILNEVLTTLHTLNGKGGLAVDGKAKATSFTGPVQPFKAKA